MNPRPAGPPFPTTPLRILHVADRIAPFCADGGESGEAAAFMAGLAGAQARAGDRLTVVVPGRAGPGRPSQRRIEGTRAHLQLGDLDVPFELARARHPLGFDVVLVRAERFDRPGPKGPPAAAAGPAARDASAERERLLDASVLCHAALYYALNEGGRWQVIHAWGILGALTCALLRRRFQPTPLQHARSVLSLPGLDDPGLAPIEDVPAAGLPIRDAVPGGPFEFFGAFSLVKAGLVFADRVHTPSKGALRRMLDEVRNDDAHEGLRGLLHDRRPATRPVAGGVAADWDPASDPALAAAFSAGDRGGREACREDVVALAGLDEVAVSGALACSLSGRPPFPDAEFAERLVAMALDSNISFIFQEHEDIPLMDWMKSMAQRAPGRVGVIPGRDPTNARQLLAGADLALLGPLPDPWGLGAAHAARYGAVPVLPPLPGGADELAPPALCVLPAAAGPEALAAALRDAARRLADPEGRDRLLTLALRAPRGWDEAAAELRRDVYRDGAA